MADIDVKPLLLQPQGDAIWYLSLRLGHGRLDAECGSLQRPHILLLLDGCGNTLAHHIQEHAFTLEQVWFALAQVIGGTGKVSGERPLCLHLDQPELLAALAPHLEAAGIQGLNQAQSPEVERALIELERGLEQPVLLPPALATAPHVTPELQGRIYRWAAELYRLAPWHAVPGEAPFEVCFPEHSPARYVVVMGSGGDAFGLSVNDTLLDLERAYASCDPLELARSIRWLALTFDTAEYLAFEDLDAIRQHGWQIENESAYPALYRVGGPEADLQAPSEEDLLWLDGVLPALVQYFTARPAGDGGWRTPHESRVTIATPAGPAGVLVRFPGLESS